MKIKIILLVIILSLFTGVALAKDTLVKMDIKNALETPKVKKALYNGIALYWGAETHYSGPQCQDSFFKI